MKMKDWMTKEEIFEEFFEELNGIKINEKELDDIFFEFLDIAIAIDAGYLLNNFISQDELKEAIKDALEKDGAHAVKRLLEDVDDFTQEVYYIDNYKTARNITKKDLECLKENLKTEIAKVED
jgi:hypothetical protein